MKQVQITNSTDYERSMPHMIDRKEPMIFDVVVKYYDETKGFSSRVLAIKESNRGEIYAAGIGERSYLYRFDIEKDEFVNLFDTSYSYVRNLGIRNFGLADRGQPWTIGHLEFSKYGLFLKTGKDIFAGKYEGKNIYDGINGTGLNKILAGEHPSFQTYKLKNRLFCFL